METLNESLKKTGAEFQRASEKFYNGLFFQIASALLSAVWLSSEDKKELNWLLYTSGLLGLIGLIVMCTSFMHISKGGKIMSELK